jgi:hypothetical protein
MLDLTAALGEMTAQYTGDGPDLPRYVVQHLYLPLLAYWKFADLSAPTVFAACGPSFCTIAIVSRQPDAVQIVEIDFPLSETEGLLGPKTRSYSATDGSMSWWGSCPAIDSLNLDTSMPEAAKKSINAIYDLAKITFPKVIGGPVDIGMVDENGARWISRKGNLDRSTTDH